jgi:hypothetical protein
MSLVLVRVDAVEIRLADELEDRIPLSSSSFSRPMKAMTDSERVVSRRHLGTKYSSDDVNAFFALDRFFRFLFLTLK